MSEDKENRDNLRPLHVERRERRLMAAPIKSTPILKGSDLVDLVKDLKRKDSNKERRQKALKALQSISRKG